MGYGGAERRLLGQFRVHMDELVIAGHFGKGVDLFLRHLDPVGHADFLTNKRPIFFQRQGSA